MPDYVNQIDIGNDESDLIRKMRFMMKMDEKARVAVLDKSVYRTKVHYHNFYFYCIGDGCPYCMIKQPSSRYMTFIFNYSLTSKGQVRDPLEGEVKAWLFGRDKYGPLAGIQNEWNDIRKVDLILECTDEKFQRMTIVPGQGSAWQKASNATDVIAMKKEAAAKIDVQSFIARALSKQEIYGLLAVKQDVDPVGVQDEVRDLSQRDLPPGVVQGTTTENLQALLDDLEED